MDKSTGLFSDTERFDLRDPQSMVHPSGELLAQSPDSSPDTISLDVDATEQLLEWAERVHSSDDTVFHKARTLATRLGAHCQLDGSVAFGFWAPELSPGTVVLQDVYLEIFTPLEPVDFSESLQMVRFQRDCVQLRQHGEYIWGVVRGLTLGDRDRLGSLYWLRHLSESLDPNEVGLSVRTVIHDVLATSIPFGIHAPAEVYDFRQLQQNRKDLEHFGPVQVDTSAAIRVQPPRNILQLHVGTASQEGSIAGLNRVYRKIAEKLRGDQSLTPSEQNYVGYDAIQLLPIEPVVEYRGEGHQFWEPDNDAPRHHEVEVTLRKPNSQNWGYDIVLSGMASTNPALLETQRPDELVDLIETLHTFPTGPIQIVYDVVYGHADNQATELLNGRFLKGPNMYGQDVNHQNPTTRAILLEMQRRRVSSGADGIRIDGAQDFRFFNPLSGRVEYDDIYLQEMANVIQEIGGRRRKLFCIYEDGRPWPEEGWEETSSYLDMIRLIPDCFQWGPLIFAHNTPALTGFWASKWRRIQEVMYSGTHWISGCGNHDTLRRGTQLPTDGPINWNLGHTLPEILQNAYDNPATALLTYGFMPGLPMDFINVTARAPWGFLRNTDDYYGIKIVAEEGGFLEWRVPESMYAADNNFWRLKQFGFTDYGELKAFLRALHIAISEMDYELDEVARICQSCLADDVDLSNWQDCSLANCAPACPTHARALNRLNKPGKSKGLTNLTVDRLQWFARAFMEDCHDICNVSHHESSLEAAQTSFNLSAREFRHKHRWLRRNLSVTADTFDRLASDTSMVVYGLRTEPISLVQSDRSPTQVAMVAHMGGAPIDISPEKLLGLSDGDWEIALVTPNLDLSQFTHSTPSLHLQDSQAVLWVKQ
ncbi:MAG: glucosylglycerol hydrolase [Cyanobacteria bacterium P01_G01_bin.4]